MWARIWKVLRHRRGVACATVMAPRIMWCGQRLAIPKQNYEPINVHEIRGIRWSGPPSEVAMVTHESGTTTKPVSTPVS